MIRNFFPFPFVDENAQLHNGLLRAVVPFCNECQDRQCRNGYLEKQIGILRSCHKGVNYVYLEDASTQSIVFNGFLVKGQKYPSNYKKILKKGIELDKASYDKLIVEFSPNGPIDARISDLRKRGQSQALHDLKSLINVLTRIVETLDVETAEKTRAPTESQVKLLQQVVRDTYSTLGAIKNQIELADFIISPELTEKAAKGEIDIYALFHKNVNIYNVIARTQEKDIRMQSSSGLYVDAKPVLPEPFTLLPAILIDNAIKYSVKGNIINVDVSDLEGKIYICISSFGAAVPEENRQVIWGDGTRFFHQQLTKRPGSGYGLFLAKKISDMANFDIGYEAEITRTHQGVPFGWNKFWLKER